MGGDEIDSVTGGEGIVSGGGGGNFVLRMNSDIGLYAPLASSDRYPPQ